MMSRHAGIKFRSPASLTLSTAHIVQWQWEVLSRRLTSPPGYLRERVSGVPTRSLAAASLWARTQRQVVVCVPELNCLHHNHVMTLALTRGALRNAGDQQREILLFYYTGIHKKPLSIIINASPILITPRQDLFVFPIGLPKSGLNKHINQPARGSRGVAAPRNFVPSSSTSCLNDRFRSSSDLKRLIWTCGGASSQLNDNN